MDARDAAPATPRESDFLFNVNLTFLSSILSAALGLAFAIVVARALGPEGRGLVALFQAAVSLGFALFGLGVGAAAVYYIARRELSKREALEAGLAVTLAAAALTVVVVAVARLAFAAELREAALPYWLAVVAVPAVIQVRLLDGVLRGQGRFGASNGLDLLLPLTGLLAFLAIEVTVGLTVERALYAWTASLALPLAAGYIIAGEWPRRPAPLPRILPALRFGAQSQLANLIQLLNYRLDAYLVLVFVSSAGVGLYSVAVSLSEGLWLLANSVALVLLTDLTAADAERSARLAPVVCRNTLAITALGAVATAAIAPLAVPAVFGASFDDAVLPFVWLLPGTVALAGGKVLSAYVFSRGRPMVNAGIALVALLVTLAADLVLIPAFGVEGAAAGASIGYSVSLALTAVAYRRLGGGPIAAALLPRPADLALYFQGVRGLLERRRRPSEGDGLVEKRAAR